MVHLNFAIPRDVKTGDGKIVGDVTSAMRAGREPRIQCGLHGEPSRITPKREQSLSASRSVNSENSRWRLTTLIEKAKREAVSRLTGSTTLKAILQEISSLSRGLRTR